MSETKDDKWEMPKPVFRSSKGGLPKSFEETMSQQSTQDEIRRTAEDDDDILSIMDDPAVGLPDEVSQKPIDDHAEAADPQEASEAQEDAIVETEPKRATFWSFTTIFLLMVVVAAAVVIGLFYYMRTGLNGASQ